jgi:hypothetical protein
MSGAKDVEQSIKKFIDQIDIEMNSRFKIINSKNLSKKERFKSEKLIYSLVSIGIPLNFTIKILNFVSANIIANYKKEFLETSEIRKVVRNTLYSLEKIGFEQKQCQIWGDVYVRKYGNPEGAMEIIHINDETELLDYDFIQEKLIPETLAEILQTEKSRILKSISKKEIVSMGNELMRIISELGIYRIHHRTLLLLAKDVAMQPPHSWVIDPNKLFEYVEKDFKKADQHLKEAKCFFDEKNFPYCRNSIRECIHHVSAAILGYYKDISGFGDLSAFHNLMNRVNEIILEKNTQLIEESKIRMLEGDIRMCNLTVYDFSELMKKLKRHLEIIHKDNILEEMIPLLETYFSIGKSLVSGRRNLKEELERATNCKVENDKGRLYEDVVKKIFELSNCFIVKKDIRKQNKQIDLVIENSCKSGEFLEIKKYIYVECKNTKSKVEIEVVEKLGKRIEETPNRFCNTGILVSAKGFSRPAIAEALSFVGKGTVIILLKNRDLYEMIEKNIIRELDAKITMLFYGRVE